MFLVNGDENRSHLLDHLDEVEDFLDAADDIEEAFDQIDLGLTECIGASLICEVERLLASFNVDEALHPFFLDTLRDELNERLIDSIEIDDASEVTLDGRSSLLTGHAYDARRQYREQTDEVGIALAFAALAEAVFGEGRGHIQ
jgi:hypothetical protein